MDEATTQRIKDLIVRNEKIAIAVGRNPTLDTMGGALALYLALATFGKKVAVSCPDEPIVAISSLVGIDKIRTTLEADGGDLVVSFPYREGEIEKVSYTIDNGYLNIVVKAGEAGLSFSEQEVKYERQGGYPTLLFIVGTPRLSDLGSLFNVGQLKDTTVVNIDNASNNQGFGDVVLVSPQFSSVSEQMASLIASLDVNIDVDIAQNLLSGISFATDNFQKPNTSYLAFETAAMLMKKGASRVSTGVVRKDTVDQNAFAPFAAGNRGGGAQKTAVSEEDFLQDFSLPTAPFQKQGKQKQMGNQQSLPPLGKGKKPPSDWLVPRVYKGSTEV